MNTSNINKDSKLEQAISEEIDNYLKHLDDIEPDNIYDILQLKINRLIIKQVLTLTNNNQSKAARWLGISRNTLRKIMPFC